jgi:OPA family glycerol-3-phosphate transporter-like MFS transporter
MAETLSAQPSGFIKYPAGFRARRGLNWVSLGLMYAAYYLCRYNFRWAAPDLQKEYNFNYTDITQILSCWFWAYGIGQLVNGLLSDRIGGRRSMLIGAVGTIIMNLAFGAASFGGTFTTFSMIWLVSGYFQAFGAPGMIKINAAWFSRTERGTFSGIFGFMIQLGQFSINQLAPMLLAGFTIFVWTVPALHWHWLFWVPPMIAVIPAVMIAFLVKETPEEAGFVNVHPDEVDHADTHVRVSIKESFLTISKHPLVWLYALAYACTGAVRHGSDQLAVLYFVNELGLTRQMPAVQWTMQLMPMVAVLGSLGSGIISDKVFKGHRSPVAMVLYFMITVIIIVAVIMIEGFGMRSVFLSCFFLIMISLAVNATHSIVGAAAPMDIGGRKMAGFASGVIDSFQYFGAAIAVPLMGKLLDKFGWVSWFPTMAVFGFLGGLAMLLVMRKQRLLKAQGRPYAND